VHLLHDDERHDGLLLQPDHGHVLLRGDQQGRVPDLHQRRQPMLRDDSGLLRLPGDHAQVRLHVLHAHESNAGLLRLLLDFLVRSQISDVKCPMLDVPARHLTWDIGHGTVAFDVGQSFAK
jgi:hypothetical protein